jgi:anti-anti-sigma factor
MTSTIDTTDGTIAVTAGGLEELVRGQDQSLLRRLAPLVRRRDVLLDLASVERIDAAGIAALVSLYRMAQEAGHRFSVCNAAPRVERILALVGLDHILLSHIAVHFPYSAACQDRPAA